MSKPRPDGLEVALRVIEVLDDLGIDYHLGGSYASSIHGTPRQTQDVDLVAKLRDSDVRQLLTSLGSDFYGDLEAAVEALGRASSFNLIHLASGIKVDVFCLGNSPFDQSEFGRAQPYRLFGVDSKSVRVKSPEDTVLRKLHWYRLGGEQSDRQWSDVLGCLTSQKGRLDTIYLRRWAVELQVEDLLEDALEEAGQ